MTSDRSGPSGNRVQSPSTGRPESRVCRWEDWGQDVLVFQRPFLLFLSEESLVPTSLPEVFRGRSTVPGRLLSPVGKETGRWNVAGVGKRPFSTRTSSILLFSCKGALDGGRESSPVGLRRDSFTGGNHEVSDSMGLNSVRRPLLGTRRRHPLTSPCSVVGTSPSPRRTLLLSGRPAYGTPPSPDLDGDEDLGTVDG